MKASIFWERNPAFFYGLVLFLGCLFILQTPWALLPFFLVLHKQRLFQACLIFLLPCLMVYHFYTFPITGKKLEGNFIIHSFKYSEKYGGGWNYDGSVKTEKGCLLCRCFSKTYFAPDKVYKISGTVRRLNGSLYALKIHGPWEPTKKRISLAALRHAAKKGVKDYIGKHYRDAPSAHFLVGMVTGELENVILLNEFNQIGVSHLMAISGLHFSLLSFALHLFFRLFLPYKIEAFLLIGLMSCYLFFIGETPSVLRAWIMVLVFYLGHLFERRSSSINALGFALLFSLIWNPLSATSLSLQLSFLATAGILFFYAPCSRMLRLWLPKLPLKEMAVKKWHRQLFYIFSSFFREALALTLAVHFTLLPLLLASFHFFSFNSLFYNLFFPFLATIALLLFLISLPFGHIGHLLNGYFCRWILKIPEAPPLTFKCFFIQEMPSWLLTLWLTLLLLAALFSKNTHSEDNLPFQN